MVFDGKPSTSLPSLERCIFEQVILDHIWSRLDLDLDLLFQCKLVGKDRYHGR